MSETIAIRLKDLPEEERPRERLWREGAAKLTNQELLALLLRSGTRNESAVALAERLLAAGSGLRWLATAGPDELCQVAGVGPAKAAEIVAAVELGRRLMRQEAEVRPAITSPSDVAGLLMPEMRFLAKEHFRVLLLDTKNHVLESELVSVGTLNSSLVHPRELFRRAIQRASAAIILAHNHPSGDPAPSTEDITLTTRVREAGRLLGIEVLDHLIIGDNRFVSLRERGLL